MSSLKRIDPRILFWLIFALGIFARVWQFDHIPPGLNQDEASIGVEAYNLLHFGTDRFGLSYPVNFISWGSGQNALYAYLLIPFVALGGLSPFTVRLPMLICGILSLPLVYDVAKRTFNAQVALMAMFFLAICPWHILLSRWGLESNILPFVFLLAYACLLKSASGNRWFILACVFFALCLYAYGTAYVAIPVFMLFMLFSLIRYKKVDKNGLIKGLGFFALIAIPIGLLVLVNSFHVHTLHLGPFTIPRYPLQARYEMMSVGFNGNGLSTLFHNLRTFFSLLLLQDDGLIWNTLKPFGYFYTITFLLAVIGLFQLIFNRNSDKRFERMLLLGWLVACLAIGALQEVNTNRINLVFIPLLLCMALPFEWLLRRLKIVFVVSMISFFVIFSLFEWQYLGPDYLQQADKPFFSGLLPALDFARQKGNFPICVTNHINEPFIFAMFSERMDSKLYSDALLNLDPASPSLVSYGRYSFGLKYCPKDPQTIYILLDEPVPDNAIRFDTFTYNNFHVFIPGTQ